MRITVDFFNIGLYVNGKIRAGVGTFCNHNLVCEFIRKFNLPLGAVILNNLLRVLFNLRLSGGG